MFLLLSQKFDNFEYQFDRYLHLSTSLVDMLYLFCSQVVSILIFKFSLVLKCEYQFVTFTTKRTLKYDSKYSNLNIVVSLVLKFEY